MHYGAVWANLPRLGLLFDDHALEQRYEKASVMSGFLPIGRPYETAELHTAFFWSLKTSDYPDWKARGLEAWKDQIEYLWPETNPLLASITRQDKMTMASYDHQTLSISYVPKLVFIGDIAHSPSRQSGQGENMALLDAIALTPVLEQYNNLETALHDYANIRHNPVKLSQALSLIFTPFYQSASIILPLVRDCRVINLNRLPPMQRFLASIVIGHLRR